MLKTIESQAQQKSPLFYCKYGRSILQVMHIYKKNNQISKVSITKKNAVWAQYKNNMTC